MPNLIQKIFSLKDIKYSWVLLLSIILCGLTFYVDRSVNPNDQFWLSVSYGISFSIAVLWGVINYIGHIRMNVLYQKQNDIHSYVKQLAMDEEDKLELRNYLEDYAEDLMQQGKTKEEATMEAISQFKVKELLSLSKNTMLFELHAHYYLLGWTIISGTIFIFLGLFGAIYFPSSLFYLIIESILLAYSLGLVTLFFIYKLLDALLYKKIKEQLS